MAKTKISEFSSTPGNNTDIDGINIAEGCAPSGINDAIRELMSQLKDFQTGAAGDSFNGPVNGAVNGTVGATTPNTGAFTTLSASGAFSLTGDQVQVSEGGTGATTASGARTNLGLAIGTDVQAYSANLTTYASTGIGFRNRIINGDMRIDQRNAGASVSLLNATGYAVDRWNTVAFGGAAGGFSVQRVTDAPAGFTNSLRITTTTADASITSADNYQLIHTVEGFNTADLGFGTASASAVTLSFWFKSSLTGTHSGSLLNGSDNRSYVFTFTVNAANTWEYKTVTIAGDTTGTWNTDNSAGISIRFNLGGGSDFQGTPGSWAAVSRYAATGSVQLVGTLNATLQLTGVQLEAGSVATPFERRDYGRELIMCQRYYETGVDKLFIGSIAAGTLVTSVQYRTIKRSSASLSFSLPPAGGNAPPTTIEWSDMNGFGGNRGSTNELNYTWTASSEL